MSSAVTEYHIDISISEPADKAPIIGDDDSLDCDGSIIGDMDTCLLNAV